MNFSKMFEQMKTMQKELESMQAEAAKKVVEAEAGGGLVKVKMNGEQRVVSMEIDPSLFKEEEREFVQDLIVAAMNQASEKSSGLAKKAMSNFAGGLGIDPSMLDSLMKGG